MNDNPADSLIDEVRRIRQSISQSHGNDLERIFEHLRQVDDDYANRRGIFSGITLSAAEKVQASWGDMTSPVEDRIIDATRKVRR